MQIEASEIGGSVEPSCTIRWRTWWDERKVKEQCWRAFKTAHLSSTLLLNQRWYHEKSNLQNQINFKAKIKPEGTPRSKMNSARSLNRTHKDKRGVWQSYFDLRLFEQVENLVHQGRITCKLVFLHGAACCLLRLPPSKHVSKVDANNAAKETKQHWRKACVQKAFVYCCNCSTLRCWWHARSQFYFILRRAFNKSPQAPLPTFEFCCRNHKRRCQRMQSLRRRELTL